MEDDNDALVDEYGVPILVGDEATDEESIVDTGERRTSKRLSGRLSLTSKSSENSKKRSSLRKSLTNLVRTSLPRGGASTHELTSNSDEQGAVYSTSSLGDGRNSAVSMASLAETAETDGTEGGLFSKLVGLVLGTQTPVASNSLLATKSRKSMTKPEGEEGTNKIAGKATQGQQQQQLSASTIVTINVGGKTFSTTLGTILNGNSVLLKDMFWNNENDEADPVARDQSGNVFIDHDPKHFPTILQFLRANTPTLLPEVGTREWNELRLDAEFFSIRELIDQMDQSVREADAARKEREAAAAVAITEKKKRAAKRNSSTTDLIEKQGRELELMRVELHRLQFEKAKADAEGRPMFAKMLFAYNIMCVGVTGTGKSSTLNTLLDKQVCEVSGSQAQGTRGFNLRDGVIDDKHFVSYLDTQGLGADTSVSDEELLENIMLSAESIRQMGVINNVLLSFDLATRTTPSSIANQLTLCELFTELRRSCFVCFTKWNTNSVLSEWNAPLKKWVRKHRRAKSIDKIKEDPPSYEEMYKCYCQYLLKSLSSKEDGGAFAKVVSFLLWFESRVIWAYNLDPVMWEDKEDGELEPYHEYLYNFYRKRALITLKRGSTMIKTENLAFLKNDEDTLSAVSARLVQHRDTVITGLEELGCAPAKQKKLRSIFTNMYTKASLNIEKKVFDVHDDITHDMIQLLSPGSEIDRPEVGCTIS